MSRKTAKPAPTNPWNENGVSSFPPLVPMVGQEQVHRLLDTALKNFQPTAGGSAWFCLLSSTWGGGKSRTADELVGQVTGQSKGWIDRTGTPLPAIFQPDFTDGVLPLMVSYKWAIRQVEDAGRRLPFTEWIPRVTLAALLGLRDKATPQLKAALEHLETFKPTVAEAVRKLPSLASVKKEKEVVDSFLEVMKAHGLGRLLVIVEEVEDPTEIRNKPGGVLGQEAYQDIKDIYLEVIPEVLKSDTERQKFPNIGFLLLCSPAVYSTIEKIPSQARRHYYVPIGRNTVADLRGFLTHLRKCDESIPDYLSEAGDVLADAYLAVDRNMGWLNVVMYSIHRLWLEGETDPVSLLRSFAAGDPRGKEVFVENGLARIPGSQTDAVAQELLFGQVPLPLDKIAPADRTRLEQMKVLDAAGSKAFTLLYPLRANLSELLETAQKEAGVQVISGGGAQVHAGDMKIDLGRLLDDLAAYKTDDAGRPVLPRDRDAVVQHITALHGISQTGAAAQYLYPVFAKHLAEPATHLGPTFAALRQLDKRLQREDAQFRLLDDEEKERKFNQTFAASSGADRLRRFIRGVLTTLEESQSPQENNADNAVVTQSVALERTDPLLLAQDGKVWIVAGSRGSSIRDVLLQLGAEGQPVRPILLLVSTDEPNQRDIIDQFLANNPAIAERVFQFPLAEVDERLLFLKAEYPKGEAYTNLAYSLLGRFADRLKEVLQKRFVELVDEGTIVWQLFRGNKWKAYADQLAEVWLFMAGTPTNGLTEAREHFGAAFVELAQEALDENRPTAKKETTQLAAHDDEPPRPQWPAGIARLVDLLKDGYRSPEWLQRRFFGAGKKPREIVDEMLQWLQRIGLVIRHKTDDAYTVATRGAIEREAEAVQAWHDGDFTRLLTDVARYTGIQQELKAGGDELRGKLREITKPERLDTIQAAGQTLSDPASQGAFTLAQVACWQTLGLLLDFRRHEMNASKPAQGDALAQDAQKLEDHVRQKDLPFRDRADGLGAFVKRIEKRVTELHAKIAEVKTRMGLDLQKAGLPVPLIETPAEALLVLTKRDQQLQQTTKGVAASETLIHHLVQRNLKAAEQTLDTASNRLVKLEADCRDWLKEWDVFCKKVNELAEQFTTHKSEYKGLTERPTDPMYVRQHLAKLKDQLKPHIEKATDCLEGLQDAVESDYAEQVRDRDKGGVPFNAHDSAVHLHEARRLLGAFVSGPETSSDHLAELLEPLSRARQEYVSALMDDCGTPADPGLGLLRYAMARLDEEGATAAQQRLDGAGSLRQLVEDAYRLREEWRQNGPKKLGDSDLFSFFVKVIADTKLGNESIPKGSDWDKLRKLNAQGLITLKLK